LSNNTEIDGDEKTVFEIMLGFVLIERHSLKIYKEAHEKP